MLKNKQIDMFESQDYARSDALMKAIDKVNERLGKSSLFFAASGVNRSWRMKNNLRSARYTTNWEELLQVR